MTKKILKWNLNLNPIIPMVIKRTTFEEFKAIGFYLTNHPLNEFEEIFNQLNIVSYDQFYEMIQQKD